MPSFIKIGSGVLALRGVEICHFPMLSAMAWVRATAEPVMLKVTTTGSHIHVPGRWSIAW